MLITTLWSVGSLDELAVLEYRAGTYQRDEPGCVDGRHRVYADFDELERYRDAGGAGAGPLVTCWRSLSWRGSSDNAVRSLLEERAAEIAARTLALPDAQSVGDLTALLTSVGER